MKFYHTHELNNKCETDFRRVLKMSKLQYRSAARITQTILRASNIPASFILYTFRAPNLFHILSDTDSTPSALP